MLFCVMFCIDLLCYHLYKLDAWQKPTSSPPGYAPSRLRPTNQLHFLLYANAIYLMSQNKTQFCG